MTFNTVEYLCEMFASRPKGTKNDYSRLATQGSERKAIVISDERGRGTARLRTYSMLAVSFLRVNLESLTLMHPQSHPPSPVPGTLLHGTRLHRDVKRNPPAFSSCFDNRRRVPKLWARFITTKIHWYPCEIFVNEVKVILFYLRFGPSVFLEPFRSFFLRI